jgi:hypothetical protein
MSSCFPIGHAIPGPQQPGRLVCEGVCPLYAPMQVISCAYRIWPRAQTPSGATAVGAKQYSAGALACMSSFSLLRPSTWAMLRHVLVKFSYQLRGSCTATALSDGMARPARGAAADWSLECSRHPRCSCTTNARAPVLHWPAYMSNNTTRTDLAALEHRRPTHRYNTGALRSRLCQPPHPSCIHGELCTMSRVCRQRENWRNWSPQVVLSAIQIKCLARSPRST